MMRIAPSSVSRRPASPRRRCFTDSDSAVLPSISNRSCTAEETLLTFWPPGPDARTKAYDRSLSGIETLGVISRAIAAAAVPPLFRVVVEVHRPRLSIWRSARNRHRRRLFEHPKFPLRDRYLHTVGAEDFPDGAVHIRAHVVDAVHRIRDPKAHLDAHPVVLESHEPGHRWRIAKNARVMLNRLEQQLQRDLRIIVIAHHHRQPDAHPLIRVTPVDDRVRDEILVRDQRVDPVAVPDDDITAAQLLHPAEVLRARARVTRETDDIAWLDGLVHQQHEPTHEVAGDGLQAETEAETDGAGEHVQCRDIDARGVDPEHDAQTHQQEVGELRDPDPRPDGQLVELHHPPLESACNEARNHHEGGHDHQALQQRPQTELRLARNEVDAVERGFDL